MKSGLTKISILLSAFLISWSTYAQQRFPRPEFEQEHKAPSLLLPEPDHAIIDFVDVLVLVAVLSVITFLVLKKRSRKGVLYGFDFHSYLFWFLQGGLHMFNWSYSECRSCDIGSQLCYFLSDIGFFYASPAVCSFCGTCILRRCLSFGCHSGPSNNQTYFITLGIRKGLSLIPYIYLGLAVLYTVTQTDFIICRYDPFVGIFRMDASFSMLVLGGSFLIIGMFVGRPYCRFLCPYGVLLSWMSSVSKKHMTITPSECVDCRLCEHSCPMDAINEPVEEPVSRKNDLNRFFISAVLIPLWIFAGGYIVSSAHIFLSKGNRTVQLAELLITNPELKEDPDHIDIQTFLSKGKTMDELVYEASVIREQFHTGGWFLGGFLGLAFGIIFTRKTISEAGWIMNQTKAIASVVGAVWIFVR